MEASTCILTPTIFLSIIFAIISLTKLYDLGSITCMATQSLDNLQEEKHHLRSFFFPLLLLSFLITSCFQSTKLRSLPEHSLCWNQILDFWLVVYTFIEESNTSSLPVWYGSTKWTMSFKILASSIIFSMQSYATLFLSIHFFLSDCSLEYCLWLHLEYLWILIEY